ncbi:LPS-assembly lipoprotein LptE [Gallionella capsiferriformans]|jgi:LPS-assembly lipoprotein|uniref:LPS-assembly lipoprotein LptE n=1 Tax=Gallionella capsiferriformans (strain ES-2) TaxID=395494 RepID=D9SE45_GALCS|nr:LPS assembly lipoprotein LptE [Gallionella capsiferriformans]ADL56867.1 Rare lipoprotein B [Gallionella capsiferriformans ES-2]
MRLMNLPIMLALAVLLAACGFHLRGEATMPFASLYIEAANPASPLIEELRQNLLANHIELTKSAGKADVVLNITSDIPEKQILTMGSNGRVSEFQLRYRVSIRAYDQEQREWLPTDELMLSRDYKYDDAQILAKEAEETLLYQSMRSDMVQQIVRRLSHAKPRALPEK